jgi:hypothetical protein
MTYDTLQFGTFINLGTAGWYLCLLVVMVSIMVMLGAAFYRKRFLRWADDRHKRKQMAYGEGTHARSVRSRSRASFGRHGMRRFRPDSR